MTIDFSGIGMQIRVGLAALASCCFPSCSTQPPKSKQGESFGGREIPPVVSRLSESTLPSLDRRVRSEVAQRAESEQAAEQMLKDRRYAAAGLPVTTQGAVVVVTKIGFAAGYSRDVHQPRWVAYKIGPEVVVSHRLVPGRPRFKAEPEIDPVIGRDPLKGTGYHHGHLAPDESIRRYHGHEAARETYTIVNIVAMEPGLNSGLWSKFEQRESQVWTNSFGELWIITGPIFDENRETVGRYDIEKPDSFFRIIVDEERGKLRALAFIILQSTRGGASVHPELLQSIRRIEELTGLDFNKYLRDSIERPLEDTQAVKLW